MKFYSQIHDKTYKRYVMIGCKSDSGQIYIKIQEIGLTKLATEVLVYFRGLDISYNDEAHTTDLELAIIFGQHQLLISPIFIYRNLLQRLNTSLSNTKYKNYTKDEVDRYGGDIDGDQYSDYDTDDE